ncbi:MAG: hypothetical protein R3E58_12535 [Phycisphaerae bacterium]
MAARKSVSTLKKPARSSVRLPRTWTKHRRVSPRSSRTSPSSEASVTTQQQQLAEQQKAFAAQQPRTRWPRNAKPRIARRVDIAQQLEAGRQELASQREMLAASQTEWDVKLRELQAHHRRWRRCKKHLDDEINTISEQTDGCRNMGVTRESANQGAGRQGNANCPGTRRKRVAGTFQKLCHDTRKRQQTSG